MGEERGKRDSIGAEPDREANNDANKIKKNGVDAYAEWWKLTNDLTEADNAALFALRQRVPGLTQEDYERCMDIANDINWKLDSTSKAKAKELRDRLAFMMDVTDIDAGLQKHYERLYKKVHGVNDPATLDEISPVELAEGGPVVDAVHLHLEASVGLLETGVHVFDVHHER